ncbi:hypothetical protein L3Q82_004500, partial [Scortum barcoo]
ERHLAALHPGPPIQTPKHLSSSKEHGGESVSSSNSDVTATCTEVCGNGIAGKSCSKICLVHVFPEGQRHNTKRMYAIIDDQSNLSLAKTEFFDMFDIQGTVEPYTLKTCAGITETSGRRACGYTVESADGKMNFPLPVLIECNAIPNNREEIPTPEAARHHHHLRSITAEMPPLDPDVDILLLIGRNLLLRAHKVRKQLNGRHNDPYAQKLDLGWVIIGDVCLSSAHKPTEVSALKTHVLDNGRPSFLTPCDNRFNVKENFSLMGHTKATPQQLQPPNPHSKPTAENLGETVFCHTVADNQLAPSVEDTIFLKKMEGVFKDETNSWVAPLPFRSPRRQLPDNRPYAYKRLMSLRRTLDKREDMRAHFVKFMQKMIDNKHAELAPPCDKDKERWYLPTFGIYHPQKPGKIRVVFDSSEQFDEVSLNDVLLKEPDLNNTLLGVLLRFRKELVAITADIEHSGGDERLSSEDRAKSQKPFTRRGVLSVVNSLFDPLGFPAPVTIKGRLLLRQLSNSDLEWDSPLPPDMYDSWRSWQRSLQDLQALHIPCTYVSFSISQAKSIELCMFSDASVRAIAVAAYLKVTHGDGHSEVGFIMGKAKLAPVPELTIPRLELWCSGACCGVVRAPHRRSQHENRQNYILH